MKRSILAAASAVALTAAWSAMAAPTITYVPGSLAEAKINGGPWTLHESGDAYAHDASGIVPPAAQTAPPYTGTGTPYVGMCNANKTAFNVNHATGPMQPYYFPFVVKRGSILEGYFDYRPRNQQEATVVATSSDHGLTWTPCCVL